MASNTVFVSNFPFATTEDELRGRFAEFGAVRSVRIIVDRESGRSRGFAFVELVDPASVDAAIEALESSDFNGRRLAVSRAKGRAGSASEALSARGAARGAQRLDGEVLSAGAAESAPFRHRIVIDWLEPAGAYSASVPDLGIAVQAVTAEAALREAQARGRAELGVERGEQGA